MNDPFSNSGFLILAGTAPIDLGNDPIQGFTPIGGAAVLAAIAFPPQRGGTKYRGDASGSVGPPLLAGIVGQSLLEGVFYPIPAVGLTLTSGKLIGWRD